MILFKEKFSKSLMISTSMRNVIAGIIILVNSLINASGQMVNVIDPHYLLPEFVKGTVHLKADVTRELRMNYNLVTEEMIFEYPGRYLALANLESIDTVYIQDRKFIPSGNIFLEVLLEGASPLLAKYTCSITSAGKPAGYGTTSQASSIAVVDQLFTKGKGISYDLKLPDEYVITTITEFLMQKGSELVRINNIKQVIKVFPEKKSQIKEYNKSKKVNFENQEDVINLIAFCN